MDLIRKILVGIGILFIFILAFTGWYVIRYSMRDVIAVEIKSNYFDSKVLIATQGSDYKDALVKEVVNYLKEKPVYVKIIDVGKLSSVHPDDWDAILIFHTWEVSKPPESVAQFVEQYNSTGKMLILATSGSGEEKIEGVDALTGASRMDELPTHLSATLLFLEEVLALDKFEKSLSDEEFDESDEEF